MLVLHFFSFFTGVIVAAFFGPRSGSGEYDGEAGFQSSNRFNGGRLPCFGQPGVGAV